MKLSAIAKEIIPPILYRTIRGKAAHSLPEFSSWTEAKKACTEDGYEHNKLTKLIFDKTIVYRDKLSSGIITINSSEIQTLTALGIVISQNQVPGKITVIDYGGACGAHYFLAKHIFRDTEFDWRVIETPGMANVARDIETNELHFFDNIEHAIMNVNSIHLIHSSGTLQCMPEPYKALERFIDVKPNFMLLSRLGVTSESSEIITIHRHMMSANGPGPAPREFEDEICIYPFQYPVRSKLESTLSDEYSIEFINNDPSGRFSVGSHEIIGITYFCRKNKA
jgi:putative methyltransferase (TIGR04325 family)